VNAAPSILILGGGCFGLTAALELRTRGWKVTLIDQGHLPHPDAASTDISKVVRMDYGCDTQHTAMGERSIEGWRAWNAKWGEDLYHECGFLVMSREFMSVSCTPPGIMKLIAMVISIPSAAGPKAVAS